MATLLHVFAHPSPDTSLTMRIARAFVECYREAHPGDTVEEVDLYAIDMHHLTAVHLEAIMAAGDAARMSPAASDSWEEIAATVGQLLQADKLLLTSPMWNFGVPSIMKAYVDHVVLAGFTFSFTGPAPRWG